MSSATTTFTCLECNQPVGWASSVHKCKACRIDLCKKCARKHHGLCVWCFQHAPDRYVKMNKATNVAMVIMPAFILFMPAPMPAVLLIATNQLIIAPMAIYASAAYIVLAIMKRTAVKNIIAQIPADVENLDERGITAGGAQTQELIGSLAVRSQEPLPADAGEGEAVEEGPGTTITCRNCGNAYRRAPGENICPACGFTD
ncbi:MAG: hypothetical protein JW839_01530 [Candidatus Lokiarchaeota archaeon]|nr:hypothetical protein [Candidatus Lokiarchaeota archaeon]